MEEIALLGGGNNCKVIIDIIEALGKYKIAAITDVKEKVGSSILGYKISSTDSELLESSSMKIAVVTIGADLAIRKKIYESAVASGICFPAIISAAGHVSRHAKIGAGTIVMNNAVVNAGAEIGENCMINTSAVIEHDNLIGSHSHVSPGAVLNGGVKVGEMTHIGAKATVLPGIIIGDGCVIGAGSVVTKDVPDGCIAYGSPAKLRDKN